MRSFIIVSEITHAQDARKSEDIHNFTCTEWTEGEGVGVTRTVNYEVTKNLGLTTANIKVAQKHVRMKLLENSEICVGEINLSL